MHHERIPTALIENENPKNTFSFIAEAMAIHKANELQRALSGNWRMTVTLRHWFGIKMLLAFFVRQMNSMVMGSFLQHR